MESNIKSSFIPQTPITSTRTTRRGGGMDIFILVALVFFVASATLAIGVFLYQQYLSTSAASKVAQLERAKEAFEPSLIQDLTRLDDRMRAADTILGNHIAPTILFHLLEQLTLQTVSFSSLDFSSSDTESKLAMKGLAQSVNSIALQADLLSKSGVIVNPIFSNINRQLNGVNFDFTATIHGASLHYATQQEPAQESAAPAPTSPFGTPAEGGTQ